MLLSTYFDRRYRPEALIGCREGTPDQYELAIGAMGKHLGRRAKVSDLTTATIRQFMGGRLADGRSAATVNKELTHLLAIARFAAADGKLDAAPAVKPLRVEKREPEAWSVEEFSALLAAAGGAKGRVSGSPAGEFFAALLLVCYDTAARINAVMCTPRRGVELAGRTWLVPAEVQKQRSDQRFTLHADTIAAVRPLLLRGAPASLRNGRAEAAAIDAWLKSQPASWLDAPVFDWPYDADGKYRALTKRLRGFLQGAGLRDSTKDLWHKLRRTGATHYAAVAGLEAASRHLGHSSVQVTLRYIDWRYMPREAAADLMARPTIQPAGQKQRKKPRRSRNK